MHEVDVALDLELALRLLEKVVQAVERQLTQVAVERAQAALDQHSSRHDVPGAVAADVADGAVTLHAVLLQTLDHGVQPLDKERLRGEHVSAAAHHSAVAART